MSKNRKAAQSRKAAARPGENNETQRFRMTDYMYDSPPGYNASVDAYNLLISCFNDNPVMANAIIVHQDSKESAFKLLANFAGITVAMMKAAHPEDVAHFISHMRAAAETELSDAHLADADTAAKLMMGHRGPEHHDGVGAVASP
jgi:hypothetical protein